MARRVINLKSYGVLFNEQKSVGRRREKSEIAMPRKFEQN